MRMSNRLNQSAEKFRNFRVKNFAERNKLADFDIHSVGFNFGIGAFGYFNSHELKAGDYLILRHI